MLDKERLETKYGLVVSLWEDGIHDVERIAKKVRYFCQEVKRGAAHE